MNRFQTISAALGLCSVLSCAPASHTPIEPFEALTPVTAAGQLIYVERSSHAAYLVDLTHTAPSLRTADVGSDATVLVARAAHDEVMVLSRGVRGDIGIDPEAARLTVIPTDHALPARTFTLGSPFNAVAQTADGRFAFVYYRQQSNLGRLLFNPNEVAIIDLDAAPGPQNPISRTVRSFGGVPEDVVFSPRITVGDGPRTLAVVLSAAYLTLIDLDHPDRSEITVRLTLPEDTRVIHPRQVLFDPENATLYVRADASDDVYVLPLVPVPADQRGASGNDYRPTVNQLGVGRQPSDMALFGVGADRRLLVASAGTAEADVIDARSNRVTQVPIASRATHVLLFNAGAPGDPTVRPRALLYADDRSANTVSFVDLDNLEVRRGRNVEPIYLDRTIVASVPVTAQNVVLFQHDNAPGAAGISLLRLDDRTASPIYAEVSLAAASFGVDQQSLWLGTPQADRVGFIDLATFHPGEVRVDAPVVSVIPLATDASGHRRVVAVHDGIGGSITIIDGSDPRRETAVSYAGFLFTDLTLRGAR